MTRVEHPRDGTIWHDPAVERGTHAELIEIAGRYKQLYDKQYLFEQNLFVNPGEELKSKPGEVMSQTKL